jgi:hypothetical protein
LPECNINPNLTKNELIQKFNDNGLKIKYLFLAHNNEDEINANCGYVFVEFKNIYSTYKKGPLFDDVYYVQKK